jgi:ATP-dependent Clp protease protease subunit
MNTYNKRTPKKNYDSPSRNIAIGEITEENVNIIIELIYEFNDEDTNKSPERREPIKLIINSSGGCVYSGFGLIDVIGLSKTPIYTICHGQAMSMGLAIMVAGHKRYGSKFSTFMYHGVSIELGSDYAATHKLELKETERVQKQMDEYLISRTKLTSKVLNTFKEKKDNWYFSTDIAIKYNIINELI